LAPVLSHPLLSNLLLKNVVHPDFKSVVGRDLDFGSRETRNI